MNCPTCDTPNDPDARFCKSCGQPLATDSPPAQPRRRFLVIGLLAGGGLLVIVGSVVLGLYFLFDPQWLGGGNVVTIGLEGGTLTLADGPCRRRQSPIRCGCGSTPSPRRNSYQKPQCSQNWPRLWPNFPYTLASKAQFINSRSRGHLPASPG
jgi:hypothetical protein